MSPAARAWPPVSDVRWDDTHRLIPATYADTDEPILATLAEEQSDIAALVALTAATNARLQAQANALPGGIHQDELVFAVPHWRIINASFCHPHPLGSRFNGPDRGAWYAGQHVETSLAEVAYHRTVELAEINRWELVADYQDYLADIHAPMHDLRRPRDRRARECLAPTPTPRARPWRPSCWRLGRSGWCTRRSATRAATPSRASARRRWPTCAPVGGSD